MNRLPGWRAIQFEEFRRWLMWMQAPLFAHRSAVSNDWQSGWPNICEERSPRRTTAAVLVYNGTELRDTAIVRSRTVQEDMVVLNSRTMVVSEPQTALVHNEALVLVEDVEVAFQRVFGFAAPKDQKNMLLQMTRPQQVFNPFAPPPHRLSTRQETIEQFLESLPTRMLYQWEARRVALDNLVVFSAEIMRLVRQHATNTPEHTSMEKALVWLTENQEFGEMSDKQFDLFLAHCSNLTAISHWVYSPDGPALGAIERHFCLMSRFNLLVTHNPAQFTVVEESIGCYLQVT